MSDELLIYTLNARDNIILDLLHDHCGVSYAEIKKQILHSFNETKSILKKKGIIYEDLKQALIPLRKKKELVLVFERQKISDNFYGGVIFDQLLPLLDKNSVQSFLAGDYLDTFDTSQKILFDELGLPNPVKRDYCIVYVNNVTRAFAEKLISGISTFKAYVGFIDVTFNSLFKDFISHTIGSCFVKYKDFVIMGHPEDANDDVNENRAGLNFEKYGFKIRSIRSYLFDMFLSYKIESTVTEDETGDVKYSICSLTENISDINIFSVKLNDEKLRYLKSSKEGIIKQLGFFNSTIEELERKIKDGVGNNYIFNLRFCDKDSSCLFSTMIEFNDKFKTLVGLKYIFDSKELFVITMF